MKIAELPVFGADLQAMIFGGGAYADPLISVKQVIQHFDDDCDRIMNYHALVPINNAFMVEIMSHRISIKMCRCNQESHLKANWGYDA